MEQNSPKADDPQVHVNFTKCTYMCGSGRSVIELLNGPDKRRENTKLDLFAYTHTDTHTHPCLNDLNL